MTDLDIYLGKVRRKLYPRYSHAFSLCYFWTSGHLKACVMLNWQVLSQTTRCGQES